MSATDPGLPSEARLPSEERIHQAIVHGPDMSAGGRFGKITSVARRFVGRATKYERDFNLQVDGALLERIHDLEAATGQQIRDAEARLNGTDDLLRYADEVLREADQQLREADHRVNRDVSDLTARLRALETSIDELRSQMREVDTRATVASALAAGAAEGFAALSRPAPLSGADIGAGPDVIAPPLVDHDAGTLSDRGGCAPARAARSHRRPRPRRRSRVRPRRDAGAPRHSGHRGAGSRPRPRDGRPGPRVPVPRSTTGTRSTSS